MSERFKVTPSVFIAAVKGNEVVLQLRQNTGFYDDYYDLPSGHVEENESLLDAASRELHEEVGVKSEPSDLELFHIIQNFETPGLPYEYHFFKTDKWFGEPMIGEPERISSVGLFRIDKLPENTTPHTVMALGDFASKKVGFSVIS